MQTVNEGGRCSRKARVGSDRRSGCGDVLRGTLASQKQTYALEGSTDTESRFAVTSTRGLRTGLKAQGCLH